MAQTTKTEKRTRMVNLMEELTHQLLEDLLSEHEESPFSTDAKEDIKALALNRLWPMYTTTTTGKNFLRKIVVEDRVEQDVRRELKVAIQKVRSHPRS